LDVAHRRFSLPRFLEIFNPTLQQIDFDAQGYFVQIYADGALSPTAVILLTGILDPDGCFVLVASSASPGLQALANQNFRGHYLDHRRKGTWEAWTTWLAPPAPIGVLERIEICTQALNCVLCDC